MEGLVHAPEIARPGLDWFNTDRPLSLADVRGRLLVLDFWTYCCINCMHVLPTLARLEAEFPNEVQVIGVHSPKFTAERDPRHLRAAIERLGIRHPVIHDPDMVLWRQYAIRAWPTLSLVAPNGMVIGNMAGEPNPDHLILGIGTMLREWRAQGRLSPGAALMAPKTEGTGRFFFPGKIKPLPAGAPGAYAVADSGHHQIVLLDETGREVRRYGNGKAGLKDAGAATSSFNEPQGLIGAGGFIYVADTGNHAIRRIDLASGNVSTMAGTGRRGGVLPAGPGSPEATREIALASVWDLEARGDQLFFANAGTHQIGLLDTRRNTVTALAGNGHEGLADGAAGGAHLAQPSGLALSPDGKTLYFADSETSSVRALHLNGFPNGQGQVSTLVGKGLFDFGNADGPFGDAALQHPLGLAWAGNGLVVADSFNNRLVRMDLGHETAAGLSVQDGACEGDACLPLFEPAGVTAARDGNLLVTDSNNHRILAVSPKGGEARVWAS